MKKITNLAVPIVLGAFFIALSLALLQLHSPASATAAHPEQGGPPWYDEAWNYRRPVVITNNGAPLAWYQVLVKLDNGNFNFSRAKADGSDVRFTYSDGTTGLSYWIESWDAANHLAYLWVRVPNLATGINTIYLYYNNPGASPVSDGTTTFDSFENDWSQFTADGYRTGEGVTSYEAGEAYSPFSWSVISGTPDASLGILSLPDGAGIHSTSTYLYNAVGMRAKFTLGSGSEWAGFIHAASGPRSMIGDLPSDASNLFLVDSRGTLTETVLLPRVGGDWHNSYHIYEVRWNAGQSKADIDHGSSTAVSTQPAQVPNTSLPVTLYSHPGSNATLFVDWAYIRQYREPEPTFSIGAEQGLVKLSVGTLDSPDPIRSGHRLTYQLTISNTSEINAPGVVVTDTLPANVQLGPISTSQGSCLPGSVIHCSLNIINANATAWVTIVVTPTLDGVITNLAQVGSPGYEMDLSDNLSQETTLVDTQPPLVNWEKPVQNGGQYITYGGMVTLEASASDNDQVASVEFLLWDHLWNHGEGRWISIGIDNSYPYQVPFDSEMLVVNELYQMFARATDRAGNRSSLQVIYIGRHLAGFLPLVRK